VVAALQLAVASAAPAAAAALATAAAAAAALPAPTAVAPPPLPAAAAAKAAAAAPLPAAVAAPVFAASPFPAAAVAPASAFLSPHCAQYLSFLFLDEAGSTHSAISVEEQTASPDCDVFSPGRLAVPIVAIPDLDPPYQYRPRRAHLGFPRRGSSAECVDALEATFSAYRGADSSMATILLRKHPFWVNTDAQFCARHFYWSHSFARFRRSTGAVRQLLWCSFCSFPLDHPSPQYSAG
jgi:hypothetical protein